MPTIYNLVGSKEQVLFAAVEEQTLLFVAGIERARGDLIGVVDATVRELLRRPRYYRALLLVLLGSESAGPEWKLMTTSRSWHTAHSGSYFGW